MLRPHGHVVRQEAAVVALQLRADLLGGGAGHPLGVFEVRSQVDLEFVDALQVLAQLLLAENDLALGPI
jgi:hypothetical protein